MLPLALPLNEQLKDCLLRALELRLEYLDYDSKIKLLKFKLKDLNIFIDDTKINSLANKHQTDRALEGALIRLS